MKKYCFYLFVVFAIMHLLVSETVKAAPYNFNRAIFVDTGKDKISEEKFVRINGIEQWITVKGERSKPVILFLHGGPGSPISPYADTVYKEWEKEFILVQWDQRGTGKTYGAAAPDELTPEYLKNNPLTLWQMTKDGIAVCEYLLKQLNKEKIILFGTSWGSALGVEMATKRPDLFYAFVGHSQVVNPADDRTLYEKVYQLAANKNDSASINTLNAIRKPPYQNARDAGKLFRIVKKYERLNSQPPPATWFLVSEGYNSEKDNKHREDGDDYSFVNYVGDKDLGVQSIRSTINFFENNLDFKIPVYFIQGAEDLLTPNDITTMYFKKIKAPKKELYLLPATAHGFNQAVVDMQYKIFKSIKTSF